MNVEGFPLDALHEQYLERFSLIIQVTNRIFLDNYHSSD